jgi:hypothetical protein
VVLAVGGLEAREELFHWFLALAPVVERERPLLRRSGLIRPTLEHQERLLVLVIEQTGNELGPTLVRWPTKLEFRN